MRLFLITLLYAAISVPNVAARGRLMEPTQRSSLWTRGFDSPVNNDDSGLNCGGMWTQHGVNGGKCGICGDPYDARPRPNEPGGLYANGIISNKYTTNDTSIPVVVDLQSFLGGHFEFRICPNNNPKVPVTQECLDEHQLKVWDVFSQLPTLRYFPKRLGIQRLRVEIPRGMVCEQCVLQWKWQTANNWGKCADRSSRLGCGPQEEFYNCADISIEETSNPFNIPSINDLTRSSPIVSKNPLTSNIDIAYNSLTDNEFPIAPNALRFLPKDIVQAGNIGPVIPKFDFFDASTAAPKTISDNVQHSNIATSKSDKSVSVLELKFNGEVRTDSATENVSTGNTVADSQLELMNAKEYAKNDTIVNATKVGAIINATTDVIVNNETVTVNSTNDFNTSTTGSTTEGNITLEHNNATVAVVAVETTAIEQNNATVAEVAVETTAIEQTNATVAVQANETAAAVPEKVPVAVAKEPEVTTEKINRGGIAISAFAIGDVSLGGMSVVVGMGAGNGTKEASNDAAPETNNRVRRQAGRMPPPPGQDGQAPVSFGGLIGDSFGSSATRTQHVFMTSSDFQQRGGSSKTDPGNTEALGEFDAMGSPMSPNRAKPMGGIDLQIQNTQTDYANEMGQSPLESTAPLGSLKIPKPPRQSTAELRAAIQDAPLISSSVSGMSKSNSPADLLGASYIDELSEGQSNQAETSTAARHGTMIVSADQPIKGSGGSKVEYLSDRTGSSISESMGDTRAEIRSATMGMSRFGYQPTAEQVLAGNVGMDHPTRQIDNTDQETSGTAANDAARAVPSILTAILGAGANSQVTDAQLDPAVQKTRENLIRQLGEAMGVIGDNPLVGGGSNTVSMGVVVTNDVKVGGVGKNDVKVGGVRTNDVKVGGVVTNEVNVGGNGGGISPTSRSGNAVFGLGSVGMTGVNLPPQRNQTNGASANSRTQKSSSNIVQQQDSTLEQGMFDTAITPSKPSNSQTSSSSVTSVKVSTVGSEAADMSGLKILQQAGLDLATLRAAGIDINSLMGNVNMGTPISKPAVPEVIPTRRTATNVTIKKTTNQVATAPKPSPTEPASVKTPAEPKPTDVIDIGTAGLTLEEMMAILNMEQQTQTGGSATDIGAESGMTKRAVKTTDQPISTTGSSQQRTDNAVGALKTKTGAQSANNKIGMFGTGTDYQAAITNVKNEIGTLASGVDSQIATNEIDMFGSETQAVNNGIGSFSTATGVSQNTKTSTSASSTSFSSTKPKDGPTFGTLTIKTQMQESAQSQENNPNMKYSPKPKSAPFDTVLMEAKAIPTDIQKNTEQTSISTEVQKNTGQMSVSTEVQKNTGQMSVSTEVQKNTGQTSSTAAGAKSKSVTQEGSQTLSLTQEDLAMLQNDPLLDLFGGDMVALQRFITTGIIDGAETSTTPKGDISAAVSAVTSTTNTKAVQSPQQASQGKNNTQSTMMTMEKLFTTNINNPQDMGPDISQAELAAMEQYMISQGLFGRVGVNGIIENPKSATGNVDLGAKATASISTQGQITVNNAKQDTDLETLMKTIQSSGTNVNAASHTISLADILSGNVNMHASLDTSAKSKSTTVEQTQTNANLVGLFDTSAKSKSTTVEQTQTNANVVGLDALTSGADMSAEPTVSSSASTAIVTTSRLSGSMAIDTPTTTLATVAKDHKQAVDAVLPQPGMISEPVFDSQSSKTVGVIPTQQSTLVTTIETNIGTSTKNNGQKQQPTLATDTMTISSNRNFNEVQSNSQSSSAKAINEVQSNSKSSSAKATTTTQVEKSPSFNEQQYTSMESQAQREIQILIQRQREELRLLEDQKREQQNQLVAEKQRMEFERQQMALRKQQMEIDAMRQEQLRQQQLLEQQKNQMERDRMRLEQERIQAISMAEKKAAEEERLRLERQQLLAEQEKQRQAQIALQKAEEERRQQFEIQKQQEIVLARQKAIEEEKQRIELERIQQAELAKQKALEEEKRRMEEERRKAAAAEEARMLAEIQAYMVQEEKTKAAADKAAADKAAAEKAAAAKAAAEKAAMSKTAVSSSLNITALSAGLSSADAQMLASLLNGQTNPAGISSGLAALGLDANTLMKMIGQPLPTAPVMLTTPAPRKIPIRPDPQTRNEVRQIFLDNMRPGVDPLSILVGFTPEKLMRAGVNPMIAQSADLAQIVPVVERTLGIQLKMLPTRGGPRGVGGPMGQPDPFGGLPTPTDGNQRRQFLLEQRMMNEMMQVFGLAPEPLEPGDPGYRGPGATGPGGAAGAGGAAAGPFDPEAAAHGRMGGPGGAYPDMAGMGGMDMAGMGGGMGGAAGGARAVAPMMEMLGL